MKLFFLKSVKFISPFAMLAAIALDADFIYLSTHNQDTPKFLTALVILGTLAIVVHLIEGIVAGIIAKGKNKNPISYGIYTFFVGTLGLYELFESE